jgi:hypothetical protein
VVVSLLELRGDVFVDPVSGFLVPMISQQVDFREAWSYRGQPFESSEQLDEARPM